MATIKITGLNNMHYYQFNIGDYIRETAHLSVSEDCVYRRLIDYYYDTEKPIPDETDLVIRRLRIPNLEKELACVLDEFFDLSEDGWWHHSRIDRDIKAYQAKAERARNNGKLGGRPSKTKVVISDNPEKSESKANHKPLTTNHKPITKDQQKPASRAFVKPTFDEVTDYCVSRGNKVDPRAFLDHYDANGWMRGKTKIKDWKACVRTWEQRDNGRTNGTHRQDSRAKRVSDKLDNIAAESIRKQGGIA